MKKRDKELVLLQLQAAKKPLIVVGTHALLQDRVLLPNWVLL